MSYRRITDLPVYRQALSLKTMSREIASFVAYNKDLIALRESNSLRDHIAESILTDSLLIPEQIAAAESTNSRAIRRRSIHFINVITRNLNMYCRGLEHDGIREKEYIDLLRKEVRHFRKAYKRWRRQLL